MSKTPYRYVVWLICISMLFANGSGAFGQTEELPAEVVEQLPQPPMENVFLNVLWGSIAGGTVLMSWSILDDKVERSERYKLSRLTEKFVVGATYGGIIGLAVGTILSMSETSFDPNRTRIAFAPPPALSAAEWGDFSPQDAEFPPDQRQILLGLQIKF